MVQSNLPDLAVGNVFYRVPGKDPKGFLTPSDSWHRDPWKKVVTTSRLPSSPKQDKEKAKL